MSWKKPMCLYELEKKHPGIFDFVRTEIEVNPGLTFFYWTWLLGSDGDYRIHFRDGNNNIWKVTLTISDDGVIKLEKGLMRA